MSKGRLWRRAALLHRDHAGEPGRGHVYRGLCKVNEGGLNVLGSLVGFSQYTARLAVY